MTRPVSSSSRGSALLRRVTVPAWRALRRSRHTALLLAAAGAVALAATLPVASLMRPGAAPPTRLAFAPDADPGAGLPWPADARTVEATRDRAVDLLFVLLVVVTGTTLAIGSLTVLTLSATRGAGRAAEMAVRRSVGASRRMLLAGVLLEGLLVGGVAVTLGGMAGAAGSLQAQAGWPGPLLDGRSLPVVLAGLVTAGGIVLGALLALVFAPRRRVVDAEPRPLGLYAAVVQLGIGLAVLAAAVQLAGQGPALAGDGPAAAGQGHIFQISLAAPSRADRARRYAGLLAATRAGGATVSLAGRGSLAGLGTASTVMTDCGLCSQGGLHLPWHVRAATHEFVSADTFQAEGIRLLAGRGISDRDTWDAPRVAVVSRRLARDDFQNGEAVGRRIVVGDDPGVWYTVVGVADDRLRPGFGAGLQPPVTVYLSVLQHAPSEVELLVRGNRSAVTPGAVRASLPGARVRETSEARLLAAERAPLVWFGRWFGIEGVAMLLLAVAGTFVVMRLWVVSQYPALGLRRAVGARRYRLLASLLGRAMLAGCAGVAIGAWLGPGLWDSLRAAVPGLAAWDDAVVLRLGSLLLAASLAGALIPGWQAVHRPPVRLLEHDS